MGCPWPHRRRRRIGVGRCVRVLDDSGLGEGTASTADNYANDLVVSGDAGTDLVPGTSVEYTLNVANSNPGSAYLNKVDVTITPSDAGCDASWFAVDNQNAATQNDEIVVNQTVPAGASVTQAVEIWFYDNVANQDDCKNNTLDIDYLVDNTP